MKFPTYRSQAGSRCCIRSFSRWSSAYARAAASSRSRPTVTICRPRIASGCSRLGVKAVQVSLDGASSATFGRMRVRGEFDRTLAGVRNLRAAGVPIEINFSPASFNVHEAEQIVDLAYELGAASFYSGRTMFTGNAVKAWRHLCAVGRAVRRVLRRLATKGRAVPRTNAGALPRSRSARGVALPAAKPRCAADRASERAREDDQRLAVCLRGFSSPELDRRSGPTSGARGRIRALRNSFSDLADDPGKTRTLHQWVHV